MDVPEIILYGTTLLSSSIDVIVAASVHATKISTAMDAKSGCNKLYKSKFRKWEAYYVEKRELLKLP